MLRILIKAQMQSVLASLVRSKKGKNASMLAAVLLVLFLAAVFLFAFGAMFLALAEPFNAVKLGWFYFALAAAMAFALGFVGSVFTAQQQLFAARDNELLLSMPIAPRYILGARMVVLLLMNYALTLVVLIPAIVIWAVKVGFSAVGLVCFIIAALLLPLLILTFTCFFAWILALISARMRNKTIVTTVLYVLFLIAYFYFYMNMQNLLTELIANSEQISGAFVSIYPLYAFGQAALGNWLHLAGFAACCIVPFAIVYAILSRGFLAVTTRRPAAKKLVYRERTLTVSSVRSALLKKELRRFSANGMYILNAAMGSIMTIIAAVALLIYSGKLYPLLAVVPNGWIAGILTAALCFLCATDVISAPSISLEGKTLWLLKSLPVRPRDILLSKVDLHLVIALPSTLIASICCVIAIPMGVADAAAVVIIPVLMCVFGALLGVVMNLRFPKFDYINETAVIKNSASVALTMFASWGVLAVPIILYVFVLSSVLSVTALLYICAALLAVACALMYAYLGRGGERRFINL